MIGIRRKSRFDRGFDIINTFLLVLSLLVVLYPLYFILIASVSDATSIASGKVILLPQNVSFIGYQRILEDQRIWTGYGNSILYTVASTAIGVIATVMAGYSFSRKDLAGRKVLISLYIFTMYFSGGLIPTYLVVKQLGLIGSPWTVILLGSVSVYNIIIARSFFASSIPPELFEAASIDGCGNGRFFISIVVPLSKSIIAVLALYYAVAQWNGYFNALVYLNKQQHYPLQMVLREILIGSQSIQADVADVDAIQEMQRIAATVRYGVIVVASVPMLMLYPLVQKYFVKGVMIGSVKG
ncbi:MAG: carbohydrate ABC transporter permease [Eubacteriales bacterium]|nr:carbohydrate ABC transporter permease [Eubacteriales bacterium]